jgi:hypothetical protein
MAKRTKRDEPTTTFARFHDRFRRVEENVSAMRSIKTVSMNAADIKYTRRNKLPLAVKMLQVCSGKCRGRTTTARLKEGLINIELRLIAPSVESSIATRGKQHTTLWSNKSEQRRLARLIRIQDRLVKDLEGKEGLQISEIENSKRRISLLVER